MGGRTSTTFKPGETRGGRKKGQQLTVTIELKEMILQALSGAGGVAYLQAQAAKSPAAFLTLVGKVLPLQVKQETDGHLTVEIVRFEGAPAKRVDPA